MSSHNSSVQQQNSRKSVTSSQRTASQKSTSQKSEAQKSTSQKSASQKSTSQKSQSSKSEESKSSKKACVKKKEDDEEEDNESEDTFNTIPYYNSKYAEYDETAISIHKTPPLPVVEPKSEKYTPLPYVFRLPDKGGTEDITTMVRCPPFFIQLDHTIAVIWSLYSSDETDIPVGINQLQWAYSFLKNVKNKDETYPRDVQHCINSVKDELINQYAQMAELDPSPRSSEDSMSSFNPDAQSSMKSESGDAKDCVCTQSSVRFSDDVDTCSGGSSEEACRKLPDKPFSVTYNDMKLHNYYLQKQYQEQRQKDKQKPICNMANNATVNSFLNDMRKDQLKKILGELDRLHSIEEYIVNTEKDFHPYIDENDNDLKEYLSKMMKCSSDECEGKDEKE